MGPRPIWLPDRTQIVFISDRDADPAERKRWVRMGSGPFHQSIFAMAADGSNGHVRSREEDGMIRLGIGLQGSLPGSL